MKTAAAIPCSLHLEVEPASVYREYVPPPDLRPYLVCAWTLEIRAGDRQHRQRVLPDGCSDIIWIGEDFPIVVGPMTRPVISIADAGTTLVGLRFRPEAAARVFGVPACELADRHVPLEQLWRPRVVNETSERLLQRRTAAGRVAVAESLLTSRHRAIGFADPLVQQAMMRLSATRLDRIDAIAAHIGVTDRHLRRRFLEVVGYSPKMFQRILRFQRLLALAKKESSIRLGHLAHLGGYADQAHMTREVAEFSGVAPSALLGKVVSALTLTDFVTPRVDASGPQ